MVRVCCLLISCDYLSKKIYEEKGIPDRLNVDKDEYTSA